MTHPLFSWGNTYRKYYGAQKGYLYSVMTLRNDAFQDFVLVADLFTLHGYKSGFTPNTFTTIACPPPMFRNYYQVELIEV